MANAAQHVEHFRQQNHQLPSTLAQTGVQGMGISYDRTADGYRLQAEGPEVRVTFNSGEPLSRFVGNSFKVITRRGK